MKQNSPGPGAYEDKLELNGNGHYVLSTISNTRVSKISPKKKKYQIRKAESPGPAGYTPRDQKGSGEYMLSQFKNLGVPAMVKPQVKIKNLQKQSRDFEVTPGPGEYVTPSDFGNFNSYKTSPRLERGNTRSTMEKTLTSLSTKVNSRVS